MTTAPRITARHRWFKAARARLHRTVGTWRIDRAERDQLRGIVELWNGSGRPTVIAAVLIGLALLVDKILPDGVVGGYTPGPDVSQAVLEIFAAVLALFGVATLAAAVSLAVVQSAAERYRRYVVDQLADDPARDAFLTLLFIGFTVTILQLILVTSGALRPAIGLVSPVAITVISFGLLTQYVRRRIRWLKPSEIVRHLALDVARHRKTMLTPAAKNVAGSALSRQHREATRNLLRLLSLALDGLAEGEPATIDDAVAAYRAYTRAVLDHARARLQVQGDISAVLVLKRPVDPLRLVVLRDERLLRALLAPSRTRSGPARAPRSSHSGGAWFEQIAAAASAGPLLAVLGNGRGRDDEFAEDWCEQLPTWFTTTREDGDLAMGLAILDVLAGLPAALDQLASATTTVPPLPVTVLDAVVEAASAVARLEEARWSAWAVEPVLRQEFMASARLTYLALLGTMTPETQTQQRTLSRKTRSRLFDLGWLADEAGSI